jgi:predicted ATPase
MAITELRIQGLRTLADVRLSLRELTVLIGANGSGKSSIIEACELLRKAPSPDFLKEFRRTHWGFAGLLRHGAEQLKLGVRIEEDGQVLDYDFALAEWAGQVVIAEETLSAGPDTLRPEPLLIFQRTEVSLHLRSYATGELVEFPDWSGTQSHRDLLVMNFVETMAVASRTPGRVPVIPQTSVLTDTTVRIARALRSISVQLPFETLPWWASRSLKRPSAMREDNIVEPFERLEPLGSNLGSAYFALRNDLGEAHWRETLELIRLGLGEQVEDVLVKAGGDGGKISLRVKYRSQLQPVPTFALSDGTLAYLAWVALYRAPRPEPPALLAFDEPELHLHPHLLMRVLDFLESLGQSSSVLVATHSDRLLDGLSRPAQQAVLCELDARGQTQLRRPNQEALDRWMQRYRGIGDLRSAGHDASIWNDDEPPAETP